MLFVVMLGTCSALPGKPIRKATKKETTTAAVVQQGRDAESIDDIFALRQRMAIMAAGAIAVLVTGYSLWRYQRISAELEQVRKCYEITFPSWNVLSYPGVDG